MPICIFASGAHASPRRMRDENFHVVHDVSSAHRARLHHARAPFAQTQVSTRKQDDDARANPTDRTAAVTVAAALLIAIVAAVYLSRSSSSFFV